MRVYATPRHAAPRRATPFPAHWLVAAGWGLRDGTGHGREGHTVKKKQAAKENHTIFNSVGDIGRVWEWGSGAGMQYTGSPVQRRRGRSVGRSGSQLHCKKAETQKKVPRCLGKLLTTYRSALSNSCGMFLRNLQCIRGHCSTKHFFAVPRDSLRDTN